MAINKISGNILSDALQRGSNLSFQTGNANTVLHIDIVNRRVAINTATATHVLTVVGNADISGNLSAGNISSVGNISGNILIADNAFIDGVDLGALLGNGNLVANSFTSNLFLSAVGNVTGGNINSLAAISAVGNITGGNIGTTGLISTTGNITGANVNANVIQGNTVSASGNVIGNMISAVANVTGGNLVTAGNVSGGNINTTGDISATGNVTAANFSGTGNISLGNLTISNTVISTALAAGNITLRPTGNALVVIDTTTGLAVPVGNTAQRPSTAVAGTLRYNTNISRLEVYDGANWDQIASDVTNQVLNGDGSTVAFTLDRASTSAAALIMLNGVVQIPITAYSVSGNILTFTQAPESTDVIDVRFL